MKIESTSASSFKQTIYSHSGTICQQVYAHTRIANNINHLLPEHSTVLSGNRALDAPGYGLSRVACRF